MKTDAFKYLINLDVLLDARLGAVSVLDPQYAQKLLFDGWTKRKDDRALAKSSSFTLAEYEKLLNSGDVEVLANSLPTLITNYIYKTIRESERESIVGDCVNKHCVLINTHPYQLNKEEIDELKDIVEHRIPNAHSVEVMCTPIHFLSPSYLKGLEVTHFVNYHFAKWLDFFTEDLVNSPLPSLVMLCPKLLTKNVEEMDDPAMAAELIKELCPFSAMELQFVMLLSLRFIDIEYFSVFLTKPA